MDFDFFDRLSVPDASRFLQVFLEEEDAGFSSMKKKLSQFGINTEFSLKNIEAVLIWIFGELKAFPDTPDELLPDWIKSSSSYLQSLFSFDEDSNILLMRGAYFLGESFVRDNSKLRWAVGNLDSAVKNMPVVTGFKHSMEMSPLMVLENVYKRMIVEGGSTDSISKLVKTWKSYSP